MPSFASFGIHVTLLLFVITHLASSSFCQNNQKQQQSLISKIFKTYKQQLKSDSVQSSSNVCKSYLLKIYSQHGNFLNAI